MLGTRNTPPSQWAPTEPGQPRGQGLPRASGEGRDGGRRKRKRGRKHREEIKKKQQIPATPALLELRRLAGLLAAAGPASRPASPSSSSTRSMAGLPAKPSADADTRAGGGHGATAVTRSPGDTGDTAHLEQCQGHPWDAFWLCKQRAPTHPKSAPPSPSTPWFFSSIFHPQCWSIPCASPASWLFLLAPRLNPTAVPSPAAPRAYPSLHSPIPPLGPRSPHTGQHLPADTGHAGELQGPWARRSRCTLRLLLFIIGFIIPGPGGNRWDYEIVLIPHPPAPAPTSTRKRRYLLKSAPAGQGHRNFRWQHRKSHWGAARPCSPTAWIWGPGGCSPTAQRGGKAGAEQRQTSVRSLENKELVIMKKRTD